MLFYYVYILKCNDESYYTGVTNNLEKRIGAHKYGYSTSCYTFKRRPLELVFSQEFHDINQAIAFEKQVKGWSRRKKESLINSDWEMLKEYFKNYTEYGKTKK